MDVRNCKNCKRLFNYLGGEQICPACKEELEEKFTKVRDYVWDHKNATMEEISEQNDVSVKQIKQWIREERLVFTEDSAMGIECENCGAIIKSGRFCDKCKADMAKNLGSAIKKETVVEPVKKKKKPAERMRFLDS